MAWINRKLSDVCRLINGRAYKKHEMLSEGPYPLLRVGNFFTNRGWYYSDMELDPDKYCDNGDLLYAWSASFGPKIWDGGKVIYHYHIWKIEIDEELVDKHYLFYLLDWDKELIKSEQGAGTTMVHVTKGSMENRILPFPSLEEQKRIVAILDQAFADIDQARATAETNLKNARELFDSYLEQVFSQRGESWLNHSLAKICKINPPKSEARKVLREDDLVSFVPMNCLGIDRMNLDLIESRQLKDVIGSYTYFANNDVLLAKITPCFENGKLGLASNLVNGVGFGSSEFIVFRCNDRLDPKFLYYYLSRKSFLEEGKMRMAGAVGHRRVTKEFIENYPIWFPSTDEQARYVKKFDSLMSDVTNLVEIYTKKILLMEELKKSILYKAFSGELTKSKGIAA